MQPHTHHILRSAVAKIKQEVPDARVEFMECDLASFRCDGRGRGAGRVTCVGRVRAWPAAACTQHRANARTRAGACGAASRQATHGSRRAARATDALPVCPLQVHQEVC
jgi:hypothetical protein